MKKRRKFDNPDSAPEVLLTKNFKLDLEFGPAYTGGAFIVTKDCKHAFGLNDNKVALIEIATGQVKRTLGEEGEDILTMSISPNQKLLATSNKNYMIKVYRLPDQQEDGTEWKPEVMQMFKSPGQLTLEMCFDPSSHFLAVGTSDSQVKVYDVAKGFQTHNFRGHRGVIV